MYQSIESSRGMAGSLKSFDKTEHNIYDTKGKNAMISVLNKHYPQYKNIQNPDTYGIDVLTLNNKGKVVGCWEVEVRHGNWQGDVKFPFREINCIERKDYQWRRDQEFLDKIPYDMADKYKVYYVQMNKECTRAVIIDGDIILNYPLKSWKNRKADGECVRQVPISKTIQIKLS
jgi:hypothetical protein